MLAKNFEKIRCMRKNYLVLGAEYVEYIVLGAE